MAGEYFAQTWASDGMQAEKEIRFDNFQSLHEYIKAFKERETGQILRVHLPSWATNDERDKITYLGCKPI